MHGPRHPQNWRTDAGVVMLAALLGGLFFVDSVQSAAGDAPYPVADLMVGAAACLALLLRRRWPVVLAILLIPSLTVSAYAMGPTAVAIAAVGVYRPWRVTGAILAAHTTTVVVLFGLAVDDTSDFWNAVVVVLALDTALVASGLLLRSHRLLVRSLREQARQSEEGHRLRVEEVRHAERERIAREMHDVLAHRISLLAVHAGALQVRRSATGEERQAAGVIRQCAHDALEDLRQVIGMLRDDTGAADADRPQPVLTDLPHLLEQSRRAGMDIRVDNAGSGLAETSDAIGRHAYRIVQEGLTNARKHAPGATVHLRLDRAANGAGLTVEINNALASGGARSALPGAGSGLIGLRERVQMVGGTLEHGPTPDGRFRLYARLP